jgi:hypothetical protein
MQNDREYLYTVSHYVAKGKIIVIAETFSLDDTSDGYDIVVNGN